MVDATLETTGTTVVHEVPIIPVEEFRAMEHVVNAEIVAFMEQPGDLNQLRHYYNNLKLKIKNPHEEEGGFARYSSKVVEHDMRLKFPDEFPANKDITYGDVLDKLGVSNERHSDLRLDHTNEYFFKVIDYVMENIHNLVDVEPIDFDELHRNQKIVQEDRLKAIDAIAKIHELTKNAYIYLRAMGYTYKDLND